MTHAEASTCLYCRRPTTGQEGEAHVVPEALGKNDLTLPRGAVCDGCNNYLSRLDSALVLHPSIAFAIQFLGIPGKVGKPRMRIGDLFREPKAEGQFELTGPAHLVSQEIDANGKQRVSIQVEAAANFDLDLFRRSLYHIALNALAAYKGLQYALDSKFDAVRRYVRAPFPLQRFDFVHSETDVFGPRKGVTLLHMTRERHDVIRMQLLQEAFAVCLSAPDAIPAWFTGPHWRLMDTSIDRPRPASLTVIEDGYSEP